MSRSCERVRCLLLFRGAVLEAAARAARLQWSETEGASARAQRDHGRMHRLGTVMNDSGRTRWRVAAKTVAGSSTGRTPDFGSGGWRFEPSPASDHPFLRASDTPRRSMTAERGRASAISTLLSAESSVRLRRRSLPRAERVRLTACHPSEPSLTCGRDPLRDATNRGAATTPPEIHSVNRRRRVQRFGAYRLPRTLLDATESELSAGRPSSKMIQETAGRVFDGVAVSVSV